MTHRTRFAPSPTGHLHLGHLIHMMWTWGTAKQMNAEVVIRIEDHDRSRCKLEFEQSIFEDLKWLGFIAKDFLSSSSSRQSDRLNHYNSHATQLIKAGLVYACHCSRKTIQQLTPVGSTELAYLGTCRDLKLDLNLANVSWRVRMPDHDYKTNDLRHGLISQNPAQTCGDMVIRDRNQNWTYQFCVVIDDLDFDIDLIIRGDDLLSSIGRQLALREMIAPAIKPITFLHHPLLKDELGQKLSKRFFSESIASFRTRGYEPQKLMNEIAQQIEHSSGVKVPWPQS